MARSKLAFEAACLLVVLPFALATDVSYCGRSQVEISIGVGLLPSWSRTASVLGADNKAAYDVSVSGVDISPDPIARGKAPLSASLQLLICYIWAGRVCMYSGKEISGGKLVIDVSYFGWHIHSETHDLCSETSCPVSIGDFMVAHSQVLPGFTPPGSYSLQMRMYGGSNKELTCIAFGFDIGFIADVADM